MCGVTGVEKQRAKHWLHAAFDVAPLSHTCAHVSETSSGPSSFLGTGWTSWNTQASHCVQLCGFSQFHKHMACVILAVNREGRHSLIPSVAPFLHPFHHFKPSNSSISLCLYPILLGESLAMMESGRTNSIQSPGAANSRDPIIQEAAHVPQNYFCWCPLVRWHH